MIAEQMLAKLRMQSVANALADFAEEAQNRATELQQEIDEGVCGTASAVLNMTMERDREVARARGFLDAARFVVTESQKL